MSEWISVDDRLPTSNGVGHHYEEVWVAIKLSSDCYQLKVSVCFFNKDGLGIFSVDDDVAYWKPSSELAK
jgi:hypothetical protein